MVKIWKLLNYTHLFGLAYTQPKFWTLLFLLLYEETPLSQLCWRNLLFLIHVHLCTFLQQKTISLILQCLLQAEQRMELGRTPCPWNPSELLLFKPKFFSDNSFPSDQCMPLVAQSLVGVITIDPKMWNKMTGWLQLKCWEGIRGHLEGSVIPRYILSIYHYYFIFFFSLFS